jgi:hypothetical protein
MNVFAVNYPHKRIGEIMLMKQVNDLTVTTEATSSEAVGTPFQQRLCAPQYGFFVAAVAIKHHYNPACQV